jgi:uncharacterized SAM-dependent methyltransferase
VSVELCAELLNELTTMLIDRADSVEVVVVLGHFQQSLTRNRFSSEYVFQKWNHVFAFFGTTEGNDKDGVMMFLCH